MRPHTVRRPRLALGDGAATRVGFFGRPVVATPVLDSNWVGQLDIVFWKHRDRRCCVWQHWSGSVYLQSVWWYLDREDSSSMVTAGAAADTTKGNSRAPQESGLLCSHSHGESSRHLRALLSVCGGHSFGGLRCCSCRVCVCVGVGGVVLCRCVCVCVCVCVTC